jgi:hypothetical protein
MTLADIVAAAMDEMGADYDDPGSARIQTRVMRKAIAANQTVCGEAKWSWLKNAEGVIPVTDTSVWVDLPSDCIPNGVLWAWSEMNGMPLVKAQLAMEQLQGGGIESAFQGRDLPFKYCVQGSKVIFIPLPAGQDNIHIGYVSTGDVLEDYADEPLIPSQYQPILIWLTILSCAGADGITPTLQKTASDFYKQIKINMLFAEAQASDGATTTPEYTGPINP